jgi:hypothetical protein
MYLMDSIKTMNSTWKGRQGNWQSLEMFSSQHADYAERWVHQKMKHVKIGDVVKMTVWKPY